MNDRSNGNFRLTFEGISPLRFAILKSLLPILLTIFIPVAASADPGTPEELAKSYIAAAKAHDADAIRKLIHPQYLQRLDAHGKKLLDQWIQDSIANAGKMREPMTINITPMTPDRLAELKKYWEL